MAEQLPLESDVAHKGHYCLRCLLVLVLVCLNHGRVTISVIRLRDAMLGVTLRDRVLSHCLTLIPVLDTISLSTNPLIPILRVFLSDKCFPTDGTLETTEVMP